MLQVTVVIKGCFTNHAAEVRRLHNGQYGLTIRRIHPLHRVNNDIDCVVGKRGIELNRLSQSLPFLILQAIVIPLLLTSTSGLNYSFDMCDWGCSSPFPDIQAPAIYCTGSSRLYLSECARVACNN